MDDDLKAAIARAEKIAGGGYVYACAETSAADLRTLLSALRQRDEALTPDGIRRAWCAAFDIRADETWITLSSEARGAWVNMAAILTGSKTNAR